MILRPFITTITTSYNFCSYFIGILTTTVHWIGQLLNEIIYDTFTNPSGIFCITDAEISALPPTISSSMSSSWIKEQRVSVYGRIEDDHARTEEHDHCDELHPTTMSPEPDDTYNAPFTTLSMTAPIPNRRIHRKQRSYDLRDDFLQTALPASRSRHVAETNRRMNFNESNNYEPRHDSAHNRPASWPERMQLYKCSIITHSMTS